MTTKIEWATETINPIQSTLKGPERKLKNGKTLPGLGYHCTKISPGCKNCYAEMMNQRFGNGEPYQHGAHSEFELIKSELEKPARWKKPRKIFVQSMSDLFHEDVTFQQFCYVLDAPYRYPHHIFMFLTKRPKNMKGFFRRFETYCLCDYPFNNLWLGVTVCTPDELWKVGRLVDTPAAVRFVSLEPLLGPIDFTDGPLDPESTMGPWSMLDDIDWVIVGGETGPGARPMHPDWVKLIRDQCQSSGTAFFFKSWGEWAPNHAYDYYPENNPLWCIKTNGELSWIAGDIGDGCLSNWSSNYESTDHPIEKRGKKSAGRLLDGREWNEFPKVGGGDHE
jgi:protein gp37